MIATYEHREDNRQSMFQKDGGILFCGERATMFLDRQGFEIIPEPRSDAKAMKVRMSDHGNEAHWANFRECMKTRQKPTSDIVFGVRSTLTCLLGNVAFRSGVAVDFDARTISVKQPEAARFLSREARDPWKIVV
jgi:hypothetical protein